MFRRAVGSSTSPTAPAHLGSAAPMTAGYVATCTSTSYEPATITYTDPADGLRLTVERCPYEMWPITSQVHIRHSHPSGECRSPGHVRCSTRGACTSTINGRRAKAQRTQWRTLRWVAITQSSHSARQRVRYDSAQALLTAQPMLRLLSDRRRLQVQSQPLRQIGPATFPCVGDQRPPDGQEQENGKADQDHAGSGIGGIGSGPGIGGIGSGSGNGFFGSSGGTGGIGVTGATYPGSDPGPNDLPAGFALDPARTGQLVHDEQPSTADVVRIDAQRPVASPGSVAVSWNTYERIEYRAFGGSRCPR